MNNPPWNTPWLQPPNVQFLRGLTNQVSQFNDGQNIYAVPRPQVTGTREPFTYITP